MRNKLHIMIFVLLTVASGCVSSIQYESPKNITNNFSDSKRPQYEGLDKSVFENLPDFPEDFSVIDRQVETFSMDRTKVTENYYKHPEFYPTWESSGLGGFLNPPADRIGVLGIGSYPADIAINMKQNDEVNVSVFFYSSWLVQTYQGMSLILINPNPEYFNISLDKNELLIGPNYPKFDSEWAQKVTVKIKSVANRGSYVIGINPTPPQKEKSIEWSQKYTPYIEFFGGFDRPYVRIVVDVA